MSLVPKFVKITTYFKESILNGRQQSLKDSNGLFTIESKRILCSNTLFKKYIFYEKQTFLVFLAHCTFTITYKNAYKTGLMAIYYLCTSRILTYKEIFHQSILFKISADLTWSQQCQYFNKVSKNIYINEKRSGLVIFF